MSKHSYNGTCDCKRCIGEGQRRESQRIANQQYTQITGHTRHRFPRQPRKRYASRKEQNARYIDAGPRRVG